MNHRKTKTVYVVSKKPQGQLFTQSVLPDGTVVRVMDRGAFDRACRAANSVLVKKINDIKREMRTPCPN